jgi:ribosomal protein L37E
MITFERRADEYHESDVVACASNCLPARQRYCFASAQRNLDGVMGHFQVLFSGDVVEGANEATVRHNLARRLALDERKVNQLFSGRTVVIRGDLSREAADALQAELAQLGALARIKNLAPDDKAKFKIDRRGIDRTLQDITAAHVECVRCGHLQLESEFCARCGVDMATAEKLKRKEDLLIEKKIREMKGAKPATPAATPAAKTVAREPIEPIKRRPANHRHTPVRPAPARAAHEPVDHGDSTGKSNPFGGGFWRKLLNPGRSDERSR